MDYLASALIYVSTCNLGGVYFVLGEIPNGAGTRCSDAFDFLRVEYSVTRVQYKSFSLDNCDKISARTVGQKPASKLNRSH